MRPQRGTETYVQSKAPPPTLCLIGRLQPYRIPRLASPLRRRHYLGGMFGGAHGFPFIQCLEPFPERSAQRLELRQSRSSLTPGGLGERYRFEQGFAFGANAGGGFEGREPAALEQIGCGITVRVAFDHILPPALSILAE